MQKKDLRYPQTRKLLNVLQIEQGQFFSAIQESTGAVYLKNES